MQTVFTKKTIVFLITFFLFPFFIQAQLVTEGTIDIQFGNPVIDNIDHTLCVDLQIQSAISGESFYVGSHTAFFNYNRNSINNPVYTSLNFNDMNMCAFGGFIAPYLPPGFSFDATSGLGNLSTLMQIPDEGCPLVTDTWLTMGTFCFEILDATESPNLTFDETLTIFNLNDNTPAHIAGDFIPLMEFPVSSECADVTIIPLTDIINDCNNGSGNIVTLPEVLVTSTGDLADIAYSWSQVAGPPVTIGAGATPTLNLPQNTDCGADNYTFDLTISCASDPSVIYGTVTYAHRVYPIPQAPTIVRDNGLCSYTLITNCPEDTATPISVPNQSPGSPAGLFTTLVVNDGCNSATTFVVPIPECPLNDCTYTVADDIVGCADPLFWVCVENDQIVNDVVAWDITLTHTDQILATGAVTHGDMLLNSVGGNDSYIDSFVGNFSAGVTTSTLYVSSATPAGVTFNGTGEMACFEFEFLTGFEDDFFTIAASIETSYADNSIDFGCANEGTISINFITEHIGEVLVWAAFPLEENMSNPISEIVGVDADCNNTLTPVTSIDDMGQFVIDGSVQYIQMSRLANDCPPLLPVVGGTDILQTLQIANYNPLFVPSIFQLIAADVDGNGRINGLDVYLIGQRSVGNICNYPLGEYEAVESDWLFEDFDISLTDPTWQIDSDYPSDGGIGADKENVPQIGQCKELPQIGTTCESSASVFIAILKGDLGSDWNSSYNFKTESAGSVTIDFSQATIEGDMQKIPVFNTSDEAIQSLDFMTRFNTDKIQIETIQQEIPFDAFIWNEPEIGMLALVAASLETVAVNELLFYITLPTSTPTICPDDFWETNIHINDTPAALHIIVADTDACMSVGIIENGDVNSLSVYPNPFADALQVEFTTGKETFLKMQLLDVTGKIVYQQNNTVSPQTPSITLDLPNLSKGLYLLQVIDEQGNVFSQKVVH